MTLAWVQRLLAAMAVVDVVVFGGWIAHEHMARSGDAIELPVAGYDPRDLLSGHYVRFRLVAEREAEALLPETADATRSVGDRVSACLERGLDGMHHVTHLRGPSEPCTFITGIRRDDRVDFGVDRFYVDERRAGEVERVTQGPSTYLRATTDDVGGIHSVELVVDGKSFASGR
jgi:uncharacterized membrane-anchored protein